MALPDPVWTEELPACPVCGYSLEGLVRPAPCPECGRVLARKFLVLHGVPQNVVGASITKRIMMVGAVLLLWFLPQVLLILFVRNGIWMLAPVAACIAVTMGMIWYARSGTRSGATRFVLSENGIDLLPVIRKKGRKDESERVFVALDGSEAFRIDRVSPVWARLRAVSQLSGKTVLNLGFRCPVADEAYVLAGLEEIGKSVSAASARVAEQQSPAYPSPTMNATGATTTTNDSTA